MTANKSERLLNLLILLLVSRTFVSKERIRDAIEEYRNQRSADAFEKMFERDKDELRSLGIPIEVGNLDAFFDDEQGYRVKRDAFELPQLELEPDEAAVVGLAARVWQHAGLAEATSQALLKLKAAGVETDREALDVVQPRLVADEPAFDAMWGATQTRTPVAFDYRRGDASAPGRRHLQPWGVVSARGRWYVVGYDSDRGGTRLFRLSRVLGEVATDGPAGSFVVPEGTDVRALSRTLAPERPIGFAMLRVRAGAARDLRRRATSVDTSSETGWDSVEVDYANLEALAGEVLAALDAVEVVAPAELRELVVERVGILAGDPRMTGAREQVARLLALVPYLNLHPEVALDQVARDFRVKPEQIVRDLKVLWYCGLPGLGPGEMIDIDMDALEADGDGVIRLSNAEYLSRPLRLGSSEAAALVVALRAMREGSPAPSREVIDRVLAKLESATAEGAAADVVEVPEHLVVSDQVGARLADAVAGNRQVQLEYYVPARDETTQRVVDPLAVLDAEGHSYLDAWCHLAEARRLFRLDRVSRLEILEQPALEHDVPPRDLSEGLFEPGPDDVLATLRLHRVARWVAEYYQVESQTELGDGGLEVTLRIGDPQWLVRLLMRLTPYAELLGPAALSDRVSAQARAVLALYATDTPGRRSKA